MIRLEICAPAGVKATFSARGVVVEVLAIDVENALREIAARLKALRSIVLEDIGAVLREGVLEELHLRGFVSIESKPEELS